MNCHTGKFLNTAQGMCIAIRAFSAAVLHLLCQLAVKKQHFEPCYHFYSSLFCHCIFFNSGEEPCFLKFHIELRAWAFTVPSFPANLVTVVSEEGACDRQTDNRPTKKVIFRALTVDLPP